MFKSYSELIEARPPSAHDRDDEAIIESILDEVDAALDRVGSAIEVDNYTGEDEDEKERLRESIPGLLRRRAVDCRLDRVTVVVSDDRVLAVTATESGDWTPVIEGEASPADVLVEILTHLGIKAERP